MEIIRELFNKFHSQHKYWKVLFFDPKPVIDAPLLLVDFQHIMSVDIDIINDLQNEGQLDHPFVEKMMSHFVAYTGRVPSDRAEGEHEARCIQELRGEYHKK